VVLQASRSYFIVSSENQSQPADQIYRNDSGSTYATTSDATLVGGVEKDVLRNTQWFPYDQPGMMFGPVNFQYTVTPNALAVLSGSPFYPVLGRLY
jgi:hypothetical protein